MQAELSSASVGKAHQLLINGKWTDPQSGSWFPAIDPATGNEVATIADGSGADVDAAVAAARAAFEGPWRRAKPYERQQLLLRVADLLERHGDELGFLDTIDMGAPISRTRFTAGAGAQLLRWYAGQATSIRGETIEHSIQLPGDFLAYTTREPVGVVGAIIPWNGPLYGALWKIGPVLATGCTVVLKPSEEASLAPLRLGELLMEAGVPDGVVNIVTGGGAVGAALASHPDVDKIAFTGSTATGQRIVEASAGTMKRLSLELGGKSPAIVCADADLDMAAIQVASAIFANTGQNCLAASRLFVERPVYDDFVQRVAAVGRDYRVGPGIDPETQIGPLVSERQLNRVLELCGSGVAEGARIISGGERMTGSHADGYFVPPTVFTDVEPGMRIVREEIFGPVLAATPFDDLSDAVTRANDTPFGLAAGIWTQSLSNAHTLARAIRSGSVYVNCYQATDPSIPFGGFGMSGYGRESGIQQIEGFLEVKSVVIRIGAGA